VRFTGRPVPIRAWSTGKLREFLMKGAKKQPGLSKHRMGWSPSGHPGLYFSPVFGWIESGAKRRHIHSLGREPQENDWKK